MQVQQGSCEVTVQGSSSQVATLSVRFWYVISKSLINRRSTIIIGVGSKEENLIVMQVPLQLLNEFAVVVVFNGIEYSVSNICS